MGLSEFFVMRILPDVKFRCVMVAVAIMHFLVAFIFESFVFDDGFYVSIRTTTKATTMKKPTEANNSDQCQQQQDAENDGKFYNLISFKI